MYDEALITWLRVQLDEDEAAARAVPEPKWSRYEEGGDDGWAIESEPPGVDFIVGDGPAAAHVALHDPARVLREVAAKRQILDDVVPQINAMDDKIEDEWGTGGEGPHEETWLLLRLLALSFADRPGYREEWRP